jgi:hypothetical protein
MKRVVIGLGVLVCVPIAMSAWDLAQTSKLRSEGLLRCARPARKLEGAPYLTGKLEVIDVLENKWEQVISGHLPADLLPSNAEEIGTCVLLEWGAKLEGTQVVQEQEARIGRKLSAQETAALAQNCKVTLIDLKRGAVIGEQFVLGRPPTPGLVSDAHSAASPSVGHKPISEVEAFLFQLPRK